MTGVAKGEWPIISFTPFQRPSEDSTLHETTAFSMAKLNDTMSGLDRQPADMVVKNPLFGSGLKFSQVRVREGIGCHIYHRLLVTVLLPACQCLSSSASV